MSNERGTRYMISDAAKKVSVEAHVLRYWEEELEIAIARNEMGHRYYTDKDIQLFKNIKELKNQGFQLKAIKMLIPELISNGGKNMDSLIILKEELNRQVMEQTLKETAMKEVAASTPKTEVKKEPKPVEKEIVVVEQSSAVKNMDKGQKMNQFRMILGSMITDVLRENNKELGKEVSTQVSDNVIKEMDYLLRMKEDREEERFKKLDESIRNVQRSRREVAAAKSEEKKQRRHRMKMAKRKKRALRSELI